MPEDRRHLRCQFSRRPGRVGPTLLYAIADQVFLYAAWLWVLSLNFIAYTSSFSSWFVGTTLVTLKPTFSHSFTTPGFTTSTSSSTSRMFIFVRLSRADSTSIVPIPLRRCSGWTASLMSIALFSIGQ